MFSCRLRRYPVISDLELYRHPEDCDIENEGLIEYPNEVVEDFSCDPCDKFFSSENEYEEHMSQHKVCNLDGCTFTAHEKIIEHHIRLQHSTGLYDKIRNINTPEDINKWIQERKQKYPNKTNIQKRYEEQEEQLKRGERIMKNKKRFANNEQRWLHRSFTPKLFLQKCFCHRSLLELYRHPEDCDIENEGLIEYPNEVVEDFSCDPCDKFFSSENEYEEHMSQHKVCNLDGCTFTAHEKIIEHHIRLQHSTGLYDKIRNINTPEDINKWIQERKQKYPNKTNIQKRYEEQEEQLKRGERIMKNKKRFANNEQRLIKIRNKRLGDRQTKIKRKKKSVVKIEKSVVNVNNEWNKMFPFKGTTDLYNKKVEVEEEKYEDDEWNGPVSNNAIVLNNALGALMGAYMSGDESDEAPPVDNTVLQKNISSIQNTKISDECVSVETNKWDNEPPTEIKIEKIQGLIHEDLNSKNENENENEKRINKRGIDRKRNKTNTLTKPPTYYFKKRKVTLLEKLLESDIRRERNILLQCVRHVINKNFFG